MESPAAKISLGQTSKLVDEALIKVSVPPSIDVPLISYSPAPVLPLICKSISVLPLTPIE